MPQNSNFRPYLFLSYNKNISLFFSNLPFSIGNSNDVSTTGAAFLFVNHSFMITQTILQTWEVVSLAAEGFIPVFGQHKVVYLLMLVSCTLIYFQDIYFAQLHGF